MARRVFSLEFYVETGEWGTDEAAFRVFHYTGQRALYGIKRAQPNLMPATGASMFPTVIFGEKGQWVDHPSAALITLDGHRFSSLYRRAILRETSSTPSEIEPICAVF